MGNTLVIREPYAALMHHLGDFEQLMLRSKPESGESGKEENMTQQEHLHVLLEFLQPQFQTLCAPGQDRLSQISPTVIFEDMWFLMKPGAMAYAMCDNIWIGCVIKESKLTSVPLDHSTDKWSVTVIFLQVDWASDEIGYASSTVVIERFDGERLVTSLPVFPCEFHDKQDGGARNETFRKGGDKVCELLWGESRYMKYEGEVMDNSRSYVRLSSDVTKTRINN
jgi:hypothetical protein